MIPGDPEYLDYKRELSIYLSVQPIIYGDLEYLDYKREISIYLSVQPMRP